MVLELLIAGILVNAGLSVYEFKRIYRPQLAVNTAVEQRLSTVALHIDNMNQIHSALEEAKKTNEILRLLK